jgi:hypothetical protein
MLVANLWKMRLLQIPPGHALDEVVRGGDMWSSLPESAKNAGFQLHSLVYSERVISAVDPVCLHNRDGRLLYSWPEDYLPTSLEVAEVCKRFLPPHV